MRKNKNVLSLCGLLLLGVAAVLVQDFNMLVDSTASTPNHRMLRIDGPELANTNTDTLPSFSQLDIQKALPYFHSWYMRLLVFDGHTWSMHAIGHNSTKLLPEFKSTGRLYQLVPMLVHAFVHNFPGRFEPGQPVFQVLFSEADLISSDCGFTKTKCPSDTFPPILGFGSVFKDETLLPTLKLFPAPARWFACLYNFKTRNKRCMLNQQVNYGVLYEKLKPQVIWVRIQKDVLCVCVTSGVSPLGCLRVPLLSSTHPFLFVLAGIPQRGADWPFLPHMQELQSEGFMELRWKTELYWSKTNNSTSMLEHLRNYTEDLPPRWKTVLWTLEEDEKQKSVGADKSVMPWINSRFYGGLNTQFRNDLVKTGLQVNGDRMAEFEMSEYKYQIDIGG
jgi:hypothetical protein